MHSDEMTAYWMEKTKEDLAQRCAVLHKERRLNLTQKPKLLVQAIRAVIGESYLSGFGIEVGAGNRPFPIPDGVICHYGDIRDKTELKTYFDSSKNINENSFIDAQNFDVIKNDFLDFIISCHVLEHLPDPIGSILNGLRKLKKNGIYLIALPDKTKNFDCDRPTTSLKHLINDNKDNGNSTKLEAYLEHLKFVHPRFKSPIPPEELQGKAEKMMTGGADIHYHCWTKKSGEIMMDYICSTIMNDCVKLEFCSSYINELIFVLRKLD